jgi:hypothetical protein
MPAFTTAQLTTEINITRPGTYAAAKAAGDDNAIAALVNGGGAGGITVWKPRISAADILGSLVASEVTAWTAKEWTALTALLIPGTVDATNARIRSLFQALLPAASLANATAVSQVAVPTRAEELWGAGVTVSGADVARALGRG